MTRKLKITLLLATALALVFAAGARAETGITSLSTSLTTPQGEPLLTAGAHPDMTTAVTFDKIEGQAGTPLPDGHPKDLMITLPPGLVVDPTAAPTCQRLIECRGINQIGTTTVWSYFSGDGGFPLSAAVYNMTPPPGAASRFGFTIVNVDVYVDGRVTRDGVYKLAADALNISQGLKLGDTRLTLWGVPADSSHDGERGGPSTAPRLPLVSNPTSCTGDPLLTEARASWWREPTIFKEAESTRDSAGRALVIEGCDNVPFGISMDVAPTSRQADSPTGLQVHLRTPQPRNPDGLSPAALRKAVVALPEGLRINPAAATGLGSCSEEQIGLESDAGATCPDSSRIGSVRLDTPLLEEPLQGSVYLAKQGQNKFGSMLASYLSFDDPATGTVLKLPGKVEADPRTGQLLATFDENPQLPFEDLEVNFYGGPRAVLTTPPNCGTYTSQGTFTPWSTLESTPVSSSFEITSGPNGQPCPNGSFDPKLEAGTSNPLAGAYSPFSLRLTREDGTPAVSSLDLSLPPGLLASLKGVPYCPDAVLAAIPGAEGTGAAQIAQPSCPAASRVGSVTVGAGSGPSPVFVDTGAAYLAGPYRGAPLSLAVVAPAVAGPFDLGNVVIRNALRIDPVTAQVTTESDPIPTILHGIPLSLRDVRVNLDRPRFTLNPTNCGIKAITGTVGASGGARAALSQGFQAAACGGLGFAPKLSFRYKGKTHRSAHPAVTATLKARVGDADIGKAVVTLPKTQFLEQGHIRTICTRVQYAANQCPKASVYGYAKAWTPLLDEPLQGPVYLRSSDNTLPDLVADLNGQIEIDLAGRIDSVNERMRVTFGAVPDAPVSKFVLRMQGGKKGLLVNNTELCRAKPRVNAVLTGQNGKRSVSNPLVRADCGV